MKNEDSDILNHLSYQVIGAAFTVHSELGPGLLESTYETCLTYEIMEKGLYVEKQKYLPIMFKGIEMEHSYRIDLLVERSLIVEIKAVEAIAPIHQAQLMTYLKLSKKRLGLLLNFNVTDMKKGIKRIIL